MPTKRRTSGDNLTDQDVLYLWLEAQDPETRVRIKVLADAMRDDFVARGQNGRQTLGAGGALEVIYRIGRRMQPPNP